MQSCTFPFKDGRFAKNFAALKFMTKQNLILIFYVWANHKSPELLIILQICYKIKFEAYYN